MSDRRLIDHYSNGGHEATPVPIQGNPALWAKFRPALNSVLKAVPGLHPHPEMSLWTFQGDFGGLVLAGFGGGGAMCDGQIIITRAGSGLKREGEPELPGGEKGWVQTKDHTYGGQTNAILKAIDTKKVIVVSAMRDCNYLPTTVQNPDIGTFVLGHFRLVFHWAEKRNGKVCFKIKAQGVDLSTPSFFAHPTSAPPTIEQKHVKNLATAERQVCEECKHESPRLYRSGWACLNLRNHDDTPACSAAEKWQDETPDEHKDLFDFAFLAERADFAGLSAAEFVAPTPTEVFRFKTPAELASIKLDDIPAGTSCLLCNRAIERVSHQGFFCECGKYGIRVPIPFVPLSITTDRRPIHPSTRTPELQVNSQVRSYRASVAPTLANFGHVITAVIIYDVSSGLQHKPLYFCVPTAAYATAEGGPDQLYEEAMTATSEGELTLERRRMKSRKERVKGTHTSYATWQGGRQYEYSAEHKVSTEQPDFVNRAFQSLSAFAKNVIGHDYKEMDEIMFNLYTPGGGIRPHPDAGTIGYILSQSLGADGYFKVNAGNTNLLRAEMPHGTIVLMPGDEFQNVFKHEAWTAKKFGPRINVSLRALAD